MRNKKLSLLIGSVCLLFLSTGSCILAGTSNRELFFGPVISGLEGTGLAASKSAEGNVPSRSGLPLVFSENKQGDKGGKTETLHFSLDIAQTSLKNVRGKDYLKIEGLKPYGNPGEPQLPFKSFIVTLPLNSEVSGVNVSDVSYRPIFNKLDIVPNPIIFSPKRSKEQTTDGKENYTKCETCDSQSFFPGDLVSYSAGGDNKNFYVFIKFFPMQYIPNSKRAILVTDATITINYTEGSGENR